MPSRESDAVLSLAKRPALPASLMIICPVLPRLLSFPRVYPLRTRDRAGDLVAADQAPPGSLEARLDLALQKGVLVAFALVGRARAASERPAALLSPLTYIKGSMTVRCRTRD